MQINIILNPVAGHGRPVKVLPRVEQELDSHGIGYEVYENRYPGHATELASQLEDAGSAIVVIGGDGSVREVVNGLSSARTPLGIIPAGMGNDLSRSLGISKKIRRATRTLLDSNTRVIDLGVDGDKLFSVMGVGFPADVVKTFKGMRNGMFNGSMVYLLSVLRSLSNLRTHDITLGLDGQTKHCQACAVFVMNSRFTGGGIELIPQAKVADGLLDVAVIKRVGKIELALALQKAYRGEHVNHPKIEFYQGRSVDISSQERLIKMIDGELEGETPASIKIVPGARTVLVPEG